MPKSRSRFWTAIMPMLFTAPVVEAAAWKPMTRLSSAYSSMMPPRAVLMRAAVGLIASNCGVAIRFRVSLVRGRCHVIPA